MLKTLPMGFEQVEMGKAEGAVRWGHEVPQAANRLVGGVRHPLPAADRVVGAKLLVVGYRQRKTVFD